MEAIRAVVWAVGHFLWSGWKAGCLMKISLFKKIVNRLLIFFRMFEWIFGICLVFEMVIITRLFFQAHFLEAIVFLVNPYY